MINFCVFVVVSLLPNMFLLHGFVNVALLITGFDWTLNECPVILFIGRTFFWTETC